MTVFLASFPQQPPTNAKIELKELCRKDQNAEHDKCASVNARYHSTHTYTLHQIVIFKAMPLLSLTSRPDYC